MRANARLGWQVDGNWAPPLVYLFIALLSPIAGALMLVFMYLVVLGSTKDPSFLAFLIAGASIYTFVRLVLQGAGMSVVEDREHYRILRYIYIAPVSFAAQIIGRVVPKVGIAAVGASLTLLAGSMILNVPLRPGGVDWVKFFGGFVIGLSGIVSIGLIVSGMMLLVDRMGWVWAEGISGLLFLLSGAIIPFALFPEPLVWMGKILPVTYWCEVWRHALYGAGSAFALPELSAETAWSRLWQTTLVWFLVAIALFRLSNHLARKWARVERETFY